MVELSKESANRIDEAKKIFITATDTDAGKTFVACAIVHALINKNKTVAVYKPISAGCTKIAGELINEDAKLLSEQANCEQSISEINPVAFEAAIAPHIAAQKLKQPITIGNIKQGYEKVLNNLAEVIITEGAGGWRLPLSSYDHIFLSDFVKSTKQDVILVVNMKLGCLNHAILTYESIIADGLKCIGWIANSASSEQMLHFNDNIATLEALLPIPLLAKFDYVMDTSLSFNDKMALLAKKIDLSFL